MSRRADLTFTPALVRQAAWAYWKRSVGITWPLFLILLTVFVVLLVREGERRWLVGVFGTLVAMGYVYLLAILVAHWRFGMARLRAMGRPQGGVEMGPDGLTLSSGAGTSIVPWRNVKHVWRYPDFWVVLLPHGQYFILPLDGLPEDMRAELLERAREHGGKTP